MKLINVYGFYRGPNTPPTQCSISIRRSSPAIWRVCAPSENGFKITSRHARGRGRPRVVSRNTTYRSIWTSRCPHASRRSTARLVDGHDDIARRSLPHDAAADLDGNLWFAAVTANKTMTVGRIDAKTGAVKLFKINAPSGNAATAHGLIRDAKGIIWFNAHVQRGALARIDPKTEKVEVHIPPLGMSQIDGPVTLDYDGTGGIWAGTLDGVLRFDPVEERFTEFKSVTPKTANGGQGATYGIAGDRDGNVWWTQMAFDIVAKSDIKTGKSLEWKLPPVKEEMAIVTPADLKFYDSYAPKDIGTPYPWSQGPRRIGIDRAAGVLWIANSWGGSLTRVDTKTNDMSFVPFPDPAAHQPYATIVDKNHNVWAPMWTTDQIAKYDPTAAKWTLYDLPTRGTEVRIASLRDLPDGGLEVVFCYPRSSKVAVMTFRSEADLAALKRQAQ